MLRNFQSLDFTIFNIVSYSSTIATIVFELIENFGSNKIIEFFRCIFAWSSIQEAILVFVMLLFTRNTEYIIGSRSTFRLITYSVAVFIIPYIFVLFFSGTDTLFPLLSIVSHVFTLYSIWISPSTPVFFFVCDKLILLGLYCLALTFKFPYSLISMVSSILGIVLYNYDPLNLKNLSSKVVYQEEASEHIEVDPIHTLTELGFAEEEARYALQICDGNIDQAANHLLGLN